MDINGLESKRSIFKYNNELGQSTVEYILLFVVVASIVALVFKTDQFDEYFGAQGKIATTLRYELEYSYRHGRPGNTPYSKPNYGGGRHESYNGRLFSSKDPYPQ
jgi:hypothetical protein